MPLFGRSKGDEQFWLSSPMPDADPQVLYQFGMTCVMHDRYKDMMATGWTLWGLVGLNQLQANDFVSDGYSGWRGTAEFEAEIGVEFVDQYFHRALATAHSLDPGNLRESDIWSMPQEVVMPAATAYSAMCFAGSELLELLSGSGRSAEAAERSREVYDAVLTSHSGFVPPRTMGWAKSFAEAQGMPPPWA